MTEQDNRSQQAKTFHKIATDALMDLIEASDRGEPITTALIGKIQDRLVKTLSLVHYDCHPDLENGRGMI